MEIKQRKLNGNLYANYADFARDVRLVFTNCLVFNHDPFVCQPARRWTQALLGLFDRLDQQDGGGGADVGLPRFERLSGCEDILEGLLRARKLGSPETQLAWCFVRPVDPVEFNCPDYYDAVAEPMDLGTISVRSQSSLKRSQTKTHNTHTGHPF
jgi:hypothetical protein